MAWIEKVQPERAEGLLAEIYDDAMERAGKVFEIVKLQSLRPDILKAWLEYYKVVMYGKSDVTRMERELIATVVSKINGCHY